MNIPLNLNWLNLELDFSNIPLFLPEGKGGLSQNFLPDSFPYDLSQLLEDDTSVFCLFDTDCFPKIKMKMVFYEFQDRSEIQQSI